MYSCLVIFEFLFGSSPSSPSSSLCFCWRGRLTASLSAALILHYINFFALLDIFLGIFWWVGHWRSSAACECFESIHKSLHALILALCCLLPPIIFERFLNSIFELCLQAMFKFPSPTIFELYLQVIYVCSLPIISVERSSLIIFERSLSTISEELSLSIIFEWS